jgi:hypothetical protein
VPQGSFLAARDATDIQKHPYVGTETVTWSVLNLEDELTFAFIPPPFQYVRPIIQPLIGASTLNQWVLGIMGLIGALVISPIVKPVILSTAQKRFAAWLEKRSGEKGSEPAKKLSTTDDSAAVEQKKATPSRTTRK